MWINVSFLNGGKIVEQGTHDVLMQKNGLYIKLMQPHPSLHKHRLVQSCLSCAISYRRVMLVSYLPSFMAAGL